MISQQSNNKSTYYKIDYSQIKEVNVDDYFQRMKKKIKKWIKTS